MKQEKQAKANQPKAPTYKMAKKFLRGRKKEIFAAMSLEPRPTDSKEITLEEMLIGPTFGGYVVEEKPDMPFPPQFHETWETRGYIVSPVGCYIVTFMDKANRPYTYPMHLMKKQTKV